jgi:chromosome segregation protein
VFLKSIILKGFKSFADSTVLELEPGVTVVVGPNGSGKSNVVDAIAWVLGAQAPSAVRSQKMDDVIFAGTATRPALGRAEVSLTIDNSAGVLPIEFTELTVRRTLFRTGESEYAINGVPCRLLDVQELLSDAGVGRQQHVIVSQGQIDAVLNTRPEERRAIIEEAAGVLKFRRRKEKAQRRLDATEGNLLRVQDLLREVRRQLRPLERQAEAARRHGELYAEFVALRIHLAGREIATRRARLGALHAERAANAESEARIRAELAGLDTEVLSLEAQLTASGDSDIGDRLVVVEQLRERARGLAAVLHERHRSLERETGQLMDAGVVANLETEAARLRAELDAVAARERALAPEVEALAEHEADLAAERNAVTSEPEPVAEVGRAEAATTAAEVRGELRTLRAAHERAVTEHQRLAPRLEDLRRRAERIAIDGEARRTECEQLEANESALVARVDAAQRRRIAADAEVEAAAASQREAQAELARWQTRADALAQALDSARAQAGAEQVAAIDGVVGLLLEAVEIDAGWEAAFEAAAGEALHAVLATDREAGQRALAGLADTLGHGAVLVLGPGGASRDEPARDVPAGTESVRPHVRSEHPGVSELLDELLGSVCCANGDWPAALDTALGHADWVVVTRGGDRFGRHGWRLGVAGGGATAAARDDAVARAADARQQLEASEQRLGAAQVEQAQARRAERDVAADLEANDTRFAAATQALSVLQRHRTEVEAAIEGIIAEIDAAAGRLELEQLRISELAAVLPGLEANEEAEAEAARRRGERRASLDARAVLLAGRRRDLEVRGAGLVERAQFIEHRLRETERRLAADVAARAEASTRRLELERRLTAVERLAALVDRQRVALEGELARLQERRRRQTDEVRAISRRLDEARHRRTAAVTDLDQLRERLTRAEIEEAEVKLRLEAEVESLRREFDTEPDVALAAPAPDIPEGTSPVARVRELEREIRLLGPINPLALEEFGVLQERHAFLEEQLDDVKETRRELARIIKAVDHEIQTVFAAAFADVSTNFTALFTSLFPGGAGRLLLTNPDDLLNTGIEVEAKPSGKNVKKLSLLSGGERSLTALAFLFAVFRSRPSPFYVMDEVEAALDDVNLHRFLALIAEFREEAQLVIVSHQKRTMEAADVLLGVTMQPGGSSKVLMERVAASM